MSKEQNNNEDLIDAFKLAILNSALEADLKEQRNLNQDILASWNKSLDELQSALSKTFNLEDLITQIKAELEISESKDILLCITNLKEYIRDIEFYKTEFHNLANQKDYVYVSQFDKLLWGDNYPALKVLFRYLQQMNALSVNWSYFASKMDYGNMDSINLKTKILSKQDLGYLLAKIKPFFLNEFNGKPSRYHAIIARKFTIDSIPLESAFFKKYLRMYNSGKIPDNLKMSEIDKLALDITIKYY